MAALNKIRESELDTLTESDWDRSAELALNRINDVAKAISKGSVKDIDSPISSLILPNLQASVVEDGKAFVFLSDSYSGRVQDEQGVLGFLGTIAAAQVVTGIFFPPAAVVIGGVGLLALAFNRTLSEEKLAKVQELMAQANANRDLTLAEVTKFSSPSPTYNGKQRTGRDLANIYVRMGKTLDYYRQALKLSKEANIWSSVKSFFAAIFNLIIDLLKTLGEVVAGLLKVIQGGATLIGALPIILIGGAILFLVVPPALKLIRAKRRGGTDALLEESERLLEAGKENVKSGVKKGALFAKKAGAAYAAKNPAALLSGVRRRNVRNSRVSRRKASH